MENKHFSTIYKNKEDIQSSINYHKVKLISYTIKLWETVTKQKLRVEACKESVQFTLGKSIIDVIYILRRSIERY